VDAVGAADADRVLVLEGAALERRQQRVHVRQQQVGGAGQLHVEAGVEHVGRGHALMHEARFGADDLGQMGQEGDDVMLGLALDLVDALDVEGRAPPLSQTVLAASFGITPSSACASQAWASISNQMRNLVPATRWRPCRAGIARDHGQTGHEIVFLCHAHFSDGRFYRQDAIPFLEHDETECIARWMSVAELKAKQIELYPEGLIDRLTQPVAGSAVSRRYS
jgi:hypothetical protein